MYAIEMEINILPVSTSKESANIETNKTLQTMFTFDID